MYFRLLLLVKGRKDMKFCTQCGNQSEDNAIVCLKCGCSFPDKSQYGGNTSFCSHCGSPIAGGAVVCLNCGCAVSNNSRNDFNTNGSLNIGLIILSLFVSLFGIIYWAVKAKEDPRNAQACGITGIVSAIVGFFFFLIILIASA